MSRDDAVRAAAEAAHDAYERRAVEVGWETQARSRVAWADVPEANKQAMYAAMDAAAPHLTADLVRERDEARAAASELIDKLSAEHVRANAAARLAADARDEAAEHERRWQEHQDVCVMATLDRENLERERDEALAVLDPDVPMSPNKGHDETGLLADLRERIARAIDQAWAEAKDSDRNDGGYRDGYLDGLDRAETIARETPLRGDQP